MNNELIIASAGSGKTTYLVQRALTAIDDNVLITTFTESNCIEIKKNILSNKKYIPKNTTIQTWFSFLLQHGVRPYQSILNSDLSTKRIGFSLHQGRSGLRGKNSQGYPIYWGEKDFFKYYFTNDYKIYSDKISKFVYDVNKKSNGLVINRINRIYKHIFIDEVQDLAGWDLELIKLFMKSPSHILMVGDPRQAVYDTNDSVKNKRYRDGKIVNFIADNCKNIDCIIDNKSLNVSHRNNSSICKFSSMLYPNFEQVLACSCNRCRNYESDHEGIYVVNEIQVDLYIKVYCPQILRYSEANPPEITFGISKGLSFDRVLIYPTNKMKEYLKDGNVKKIETICPRFYVAVTRARYSVAFVYDFNDEDTFIDGIQKFNSTN